jgi:hypothetical protein
MDGLAGSHAFVSSVQGLARTIFEDIYYACRHMMASFYKIWMCLKAYLAWLFTPPKENSLPLATLPLA